MRDKILPGFSRACPGGSRVARHSTGDRADVHTQKCISPSGELIRVGAVAVLFLRKEIKGPDQCTPAGVLGKGDGGGCRWEHLAELSATRLVRLLQLRLH